MNPVQNGNSVGSLSEEQKSLVLGCLLGDGYMRCKINAHLQVTHSIHQRSYVDWKYKYLLKYVLTPPKAYKGNGKRIGYRFFTRSLPVFTGFYRRFYIDRKKQVPEDLVMTPLVLAVWYMDDGSKSRQSSYLNTQQFSLEDQEYLQFVLQRDCGLQSHLDRDKIYTRLRFSVEDSQHLKKVIAPFIFPSFPFKLSV